MDQLNNNISTNALPKIHVALRILPLSSEDRPQNIIKISENEVLMTTPTKCYVFEFDHVVTETPNYLYNTLPHTITNELLLGQNSSLFTYDLTQQQDGFDLKMISLLSYRLFSLKDSNSTISVQYIELTENHTAYRDLLNNDPQYLPIDHSRLQYKTNKVQDIEQYYKLGSEKHEPLCVSIFSLTLAQDAKIATFYLVNISGVDYTTRDAVTDNWLHNINLQHRVEDQELGGNNLPLYNLFIRSKNIYFVPAIQPSHERQAENMMHYASTIYSYAKGRDPHHVENEAVQRFEQWITKLANINGSSESILQQHHIHHHHQLYQYRGSVNTSSSSEYDRHRHVSMFSSVSNSTALTIPESITEEKDHLVFADLYRQIEELQNQVTVTRERNKLVEKELQELRSMSSVDIQYPRNDMYKSNSSIDSGQNNHAIHADMEKLLEVEEKQSMLIDGLESRLEQTEGLNKNLEQQLDLLEKEKKIFEENAEKQLKWVMTEINSLGIKKDEIQLMASVIDQRLDNQEYKNTQNVEEIAQLRARYQSQETENVKKNRFIESVAYQLLTSTTSTHTDESLDSINENRFEELNRCIKELVIQRNRYCEQLKESKDEYEKLQHAFTMRNAKADLVEKKSHNLEKELDSMRKLLREKDSSGMIKKLEDKIMSMTHEKENTQSDFESSYESALNDIKSIQKKADEHLYTIQALERTTVGLHEQLNNSSAALIQKEDEINILVENNQRLLKINEGLRKQIQATSFENQKPNFDTATEFDKLSKMRRSRSSAPVKSSAISYLKNLGEKKPNRFSENQNQLIKWYRQKTESPFGKIEIADRLLQMSEENYQLKAYADQLETKIITQRQESFKEIRSLEEEIITLTNTNDKLQWQADQALPVGTRKNSSVRASSSTLLQNISLPLPPNRPPLRNDSLNSPRQSGKKSNFSTNNLGLERKSSIPPSPQSDTVNSRHNSYITVRSATSSLPPPSEPPTNPLPPIPSGTGYTNIVTTPENVQDSYLGHPSILADRESSLSVNSAYSTQPLTIEQYETMVRSYKNKIHMLESDIRIHQQVISKLETQLLTSETKVQEQKDEIGQLTEESQMMDRTTMSLKTEIALINDELKQERELKQTAEKQCQALSRRLESALNKKSKFRCF